jgi:hypothetical protein
MKGWVVKQGEEGAPIEDMGVIFRGSCKLARLLYNTLNKIAELDLVIHYIKKGIDYDGPCDISFRLCLINPKGKVVDDTTYYRNFIIDR